MTDLFGAHAALVCVQPRGSRVLVEREISASRCNGWDGAVKLACIAYFFTACSEVSVRGGRDGPWLEVLGKGMGDRDAREVRGSPGAEMSRGWS